MITFCVKMIRSAMNTSVINDIYFIVYKKAFFTIIIM